jgi:hypothetical protein
VAELPVVVAPEPPVLDVPELCPVDGPLPACPDVWLAPELETLPELEPAVTPEPLDEPATGLLLAHAPMAKLASAHVTGRTNWTTLMPHHPCTTKPDGVVSKRRAADRSDKSGKLSRRRPGEPSIGQS